MNRTNSNIRLFQIDTHSDTVRRWTDGFREGAYRVAHDLFPGRILNRADATFSNHGDDSYGCNWRRGMTSNVVAPWLRGNRGRWAGRAWTGHVTATAPAESGSARRGEHWRCSREAAPGEMEKARSGGGGSGGGGGESGRHGRTWAWAWAWPRRSRGRSRRLGLEPSSSRTFLPSWLPGRIVTMKNGRSR